MQGCQHLDTCETFGDAPSARKPSLEWEHLLRRHPISVDFTQHSLVVFILLPRMTFLQVPKLDQVGIFKGT